MASFSIQSFIQQLATEQRHEVPRASSEATKTLNTSNENISLVAKNAFVTMTRETFQKEIQTDLSLLFNKVKSNRRNFSPKVLNAILSINMIANEYFASEPKKTSSIAVPSTNSPSVSKQVFELLKDNLRTVPIKTSLQDNSKSERELFDRCRDIVNNIDTNLLRGFVESSNKFSSVDELKYALTAYLNFTALNESRWLDAEQAQSSPGEFLIHCCESATSLERFQETFGEIPHPDDLKQTHQQFRQLYSFLNTQHAKKVKAKLVSLNLTKEEQRMLEDICKELKIDFDSKIAPDLKGKVLAWIVDKFSVALQKHRVFVGDIPQSKNQSLQRFKAHIQDCIKKLEKLPDDDLFKAHFLSVIKESDNIIHLDDTKFQGYKRIVLHRRLKGAKQRFISVQQHWKVQHSKELVQRIAETHPRKTDTLETLIQELQSHITITVDEREISCSDLASKLLDLKKTFENTTNGQHSPQTINKTRNYLQQIHDHLSLGFEGTENIKTVLKTILEIDSQDDFAKAFTKEADRIIDHLRKRGQFQSITGELSQVLQINQRTQVTSAFLNLLNGTRPSAIRLQVSVFDQYLKSIGPDATTNFKWPQTKRLYQGTTAVLGHVEALLNSLKKERDLIETQDEQLISKMLETFAQNLTANTLATSTHEVRKYTDRINIKKIEMKIDDWNNRLGQISQEIKGADSKVLQKLLSELDTIARNLNPVRDSPEMKKHRTVIKELEGKLQQIYTQVNNAKLSMNFSQIRKDYRSEKHDDDLKKRVRSFSGMLTSAGQSQDKKSTLQDQIRSNAIKAWQNDHPGAVRDIRNYQRALQASRRGGGF